MSKTVKDIMLEVKDGAAKDRENEVFDILLPLHQEIENMENLLIEIKKQYDELSEMTVDEVYYKFLDD